ncbi:hypothetical protein OESDEN_24286, partial [Oesophagostomum dentatum]
MYCYGIRKNSYKSDFFESLRKYFAEEAFYYDRDGDNLLRAMTCVNITYKLNGQVYDAIMGRLPEKVINYIGENDNTGQYTLYTYVKNNLRR